MKNRMVKLRFFTIAQWQREQEFLRALHNKGWKFVKLNFLGLYHFEKCEPEDVVYQLDYNPDGITHKAEYIQMFYDCGWEYLQDFMGYSYFRKPSAEMDGDEEIFCDDSSRQDFMRRVFKGRIIPILILFCCVIIPQLFISFNQNGLYGKIFAGIYGALFVLYLVIFLMFAIWYRRYCKPSK